MEHEDVRPVNIGTSLLIVVFLVLCLVTFATIAFSGAWKTWNEEQTNAERRTAYYEACNNAEDEIAAALAEGKTGNLEFEVPVDDTRTLQVGIEADEEGNYTVTKWQIVSSGTWEGTEHVKLISVS